VVSITSAQESKPLKYPETKKVDVVDNYHGVMVADPYRWLEEDVRKSQDVANWVEAQNRVTFAYLESIPQREAIKKRITDLFNFEKISAPFKVGGRYFFFRNDGLQNQNVLFFQNSLDSEPKLLMDPNTWSKDGTIALAGLAISDDAQLMAYGVAEAGSDWTTWKVFDIAANKPLPDELKWGPRSKT
jgi:prolyl oligopeptidase